MARYLVLTMYNLGEYSAEDELIYLDKNNLTYSDVLHYDEEKSAYVCDGLSDENMSVLNTEMGQFYDRIWEQLGEALSIYHNVNYGIQYWKYYSSYYFPLLMNLYYQRYIYIKRALLLYPDIKIRVYLADMYCWARHKGRDYGALDLIVQTIDYQVLKGIGYSNIEIRYVKGTDLAENKIRTKLDVKNILKNIYLMLNRGCDVLSTYEFGNVKMARTQLMGKVAFYQSGPDCNCAVEVDSVGRHKLVDRLAGVATNELEHIFISNLEYNLHIMFMEGYNEIKRYNRRFKLMKPSVFVKKGYSDTEMEYAAQIYGQGGVIANCAHSLEESIKQCTALTQFYSQFNMGWTISKYMYDDRWLPIPAAKYWGERDKRDYMSNEHILYVMVGQFAGSVSHIGVAQDVYLSSWSNHYRLVLRPKKFFDALNGELVNWLQYRIRDDANLNVEEFIKKECPNSLIDYGFSEHNSNNFKQSVCASRIVVCECVMSTVFFESIKYGVPAIIIDDMNYGDFFSDAFSELYAEMKAVQLIVDSGDEAAKIINENYDSFDKWWNQHERRLVVDRLLKNFWYELEDINEVEYWKNLIGIIQKKDV